MTTDRIAVLACGVLEWNIRELAKELPPERLLIEILPAQLHQNPARLRELLQGRIDELSAVPEIRAIVLGYGVCGRGTVELVARSVPLVLPRTQDCIGICLGSHFRYATEFAARPGTRYLTHGWYEKTVERSPREQYHTDRNRSLFGQDYEDLSRRYGMENADFICRFRDSGSGLPARRLHPLRRGSRLPSGRRGHAQHGFLPRLGARGAGGRRLPAPGHAGGRLGGFPDPAGAAGTAR